MVDRSARDAYAQVLRHFAAGVIAVDEYEDRFDQIADGLPHDDTRDPALWGIWWEVWMCYDDLRTDRLRGKYALDPETRRVIARAILFLYSDREYAWPKDVFGNLLANILGTLQIVLMLGALPIYWLIPGLRLIWGTLMLGLLVLIMGLQGRVWDRQNIEYWPFTNRADEEEERSRPRLLAGSR